MKLLPLKFPPIPKLLHRRECLVPTRNGWLVLAAVVLLTGIVSVFGVYPFLALRKEVPGGILVAEGWAPDYVLADALTEFKKGGYDGLFVTGIPMELGDVLYEHKSYAELGAATLLKLGADPAVVYPVPTPNVKQDRTYASAVELKKWLTHENFPQRRINVVTVGAHARRTHLLYEKAFGRASEVGVVPIVDRAFNPTWWFRSSQGFRSVTGEFIAYVYARFLFFAGE